MNSSKEKSSEVALQNQDALQQKIALLEKQLQWEKLRTDALNTMINIAEQQLEITIIKKSGTQQSYR